MNQAVQTTSSPTFANITINGAVHRTIDTLTGGSTFNIAPDDNDCFVINAGVGANTINMSGINNTNYGQSGTIILINNAAGNTWNPLPPYMKTPSGASINFVTTPNGISLISYFIINENNILSSYIGNFA